MRGAVTILTGNPPRSALRILTSTRSPVPALPAGRVPVRGAIPISTGSPPLGAVRIADRPWPRVATAWVAGGRAVAGIVIDRPGAGAAGWVGGRLGRVGLEQGLGRLRAALGQVGGLS